MKQISIILFLFSVWIVAISAQEQNVISTTGCYLESGSGSISITIGEVLTSTHSTATSVLTQGFHQTFLNIVGIDYTPHIQGKLSIFPNPVKDILRLQVDDYEGCSYLLYNINGAVIYQTDIHGRMSEIDFESLSSAMYLLKVYRDNEEVQSFKIIKH